MFQLAHKKEPARTTQTPVLSVIMAPPAQPLGGYQFLSSGPEDCELSVDPEVFGRGGVGVDSEYDLELRISSNMGRPETVLTDLKTVRW
jgi:hypothetical protein